MFLFGKTMTNRLNGKKNELNPRTCSLVNDVTRSSSKGSIKKNKKMTLFGISNTIFLSLTKGTIQLQ